MPSCKVLLGVHGALLISAKSGVFHPGFILQEKRHTQKSRSRSSTAGQIHSSFLTAPMRS
jgi:hypothetical protein